MTKQNEMEAYITHGPNEVIGYYGSGSNSYLFYAVPLTFLAGVMYHLLSYGGLPLVAAAMFAWYKFFHPGVYFIINHRGVVVQSAFGFSLWVYQWSEIAAVRFTVKLVHGRGGSVIENTIVFQREAGGRDVVLHLFGMEKQFDAIRRKVERLAADHRVVNQGVVQA